MAFGDSDEHTDEAGHWITIPYNGRPTVKLFFPNDIEIGGPKPVSLFWRGNAQKKDLFDFAHHIYELEDHRVKLDQDELYEAGEEGVDGFISFVLRGPGRTEVALWADLHPEREDMMTPEVGISLDAERILGAHFLYSCIRLMKRTIQIAHISLGELEDLIPLVMTKVQRRYMHSRVSVGLAEN